MHNNIEVIRNILPLLETIEEGLEHVQEQLAQLRYEEALELLQGTTLGILSIEEALEPMADRIKDNNISALGSSLKIAMGQVVTSYEGDHKENVEKQIQDKVIPDFKNWKNEIERVLRSYVDS